MTIMERDRIKSKLTGEIFEVIGFTDTIVTGADEEPPEGRVCSIRVDRPRFAAYQRLLIRAR